MPYRSRTKEAPPRRSGTPCQDDLAIPTLFLLLGVLLLGIMLVARSAGAREGGLGVAALAFGAWSWIQARR